MSRAALLVASLSAAMVLAGCGVPVDPSPVTIPASEVPELAPSPTPEGTG